MPAVIPAVTQRPPDAAPDTDAALIGRSLREPDRFAAIFDRPRRS